MLGRSLGVGIFCVVTAASFSSCSSESEDESTPSGGSGGAVVSDDAAVEAWVETGPEEVGIEAPVMEAAPASCPEGSWGDIPNTKCDLIEQECANGLTCYPNVLGGIPGTSCTFIGNGLKVRGQGCEQNTECAQGLVCLMKYCTPFCCPDLQYELCGPGGLCNVSFQVSSTRSVLICSYPEPCTLWESDCPPDEACQPLGTDGATSCTPPATGAFVGEGERCEAKNDCGDAQACVGSSKPVCRYLCKLGDAPFDAGVEGGEPGKGGCPDGQTCRSLSDSPPWLGICSLD